MAKAVMAASGNLLGMPREVRFSIQPRGFDVLGAQREAARRILIIRLPHGGVDIRCRIDAELPPRGRGPVSALVGVRHSAAVRAAVGARTSVGRRGRCFAPV